MSGIRFILLAGAACLLMRCGSEAAAPKQTPASQEMPANTEPAPVEITQLNCWQERGNFYVTGICNSRSDQWQKIWLRMEPMSRSGKTLYVDGTASAVFPVFSTAIPPRGRSAFFKGWPLSKFSEGPDTCRITSAGGLKMEAGPVLVAENISGLRVLTLTDPANPASEKIEHGWQVTAVISNPLEYTAVRPFVEMLVYGKDNRLWFATNIDTEDPRVQGMMKMESTGPMKPGNKRSFTTQVTYGNLPMQLNTKKIGKIEVLAFEHR